MFNAASMIGRHGGQGFMPLTVVNGDGSLGAGTGWTVRVGTGPGIHASGHFVLSDTASAAWWDQEIDVTAYADEIDTGRYELQMEWIWTSFNDADIGRCIMEARNEADEVLLLMTGPWTNPTDASWTAASAAMPVPTGTRAVRIGFQGDRDAGTELSVYIDNITASLVQTDFIVHRVHSERDDGTGWTREAGSGTIGPYTAGHWPFSGLGAGDVAGATHVKYISLTPEQLALVAAGCEARLYCQMVNWNDDDTGRVAIVFRNNLAVEQSRIQTGAGQHDPNNNGTGFVISLADVGAAVTEFKLHYIYNRVDGTALDCAISYMDLLFMEPVV